MTPVQIVGWLLVLLCPFSVGAAWYCWSLHQRSRHYDSRNPKPILRLSLVLAITSTLAALGSVFLAVASVLYLTGHIGIVQRLTSGVLSTYIPLILVPIVNAGYLRWREKQGSDD